MARKPFTPLVVKGAPDHGSDALTEAEQHVVDRVVAETIGMPELMAMARGAKARMAVASVILSEGLVI